MGKEFLCYNQIIGAVTITNELGKDEIGIHDPRVAQDLVTLFQISETYQKMDNFIEIQGKNLDMLYEQLNYTYNEFGEKDDKEARHKHYKNILKNLQRTKEIPCIHLQDKINILVAFCKKNLVIDSITFINTNGKKRICLLSSIGSVDKEYDEDSDPYVVIIPEVIFDTAGVIQSEENNDGIFEMNIGDIQEIIVNKTKYIFLA